MYLLKYIFLESWNLSLVNLDFRILNNEYILIFIFYFYKKKTTSGLRCHAPAERKQVWRIHGRKKHKTKRRQQSKTIYFTHT